MGVSKGHVRVRNALICQIRIVDLNAQICQTRSPNFREIAQPGHHPLNRTEMICQGVETFKLPSGGSLTIAGMQRNQFIITRRDGSSYTTIHAATH
jgi:hypothetical protein